MAPIAQFTPDATLTKRNTGDVGSNVLVIVLAVVGAVALLLVILAIIAFIYRRRNRSVALHTSVDEQNAKVYGHKNTLSDASSISPLLQPQPHWKYVEDDLKDDHHLPTEYNQSQGETHPLTNSFSVKETRLEGNHLAPIITNVTPFMTESTTPMEAMRKSLPPLMIPQSINQSTTSKPIAMIDPISSSHQTSHTPYPTSSAASDSSESLYSQASGPPYTPRKAPSIAAPIFLPPLPDYVLSRANEDANDANTLVRSDTRVISRMLEKRAKRSSDKPTRSASQTSHIERAGSIRSVGSSPADEVGTFRTRLAKKKRSMPAMPMASVAEASDSSSIATYSSMPAMAWQVPRALPPAPPTNATTPSSWQGSGFAQPSPQREQVLNRPLPIHPNTASLRIAPRLLTQSHIPLLKIEA